jgi:diadenosine tetraphosphatase ApaH/serine/threonine PP2A family protein phosphatase
MRALVISDIHANRAAFEAVLEDADRLGYDGVWCLGDIVGYGPEPDWCVARVRTLGAAAACGLQALVGNHDYAVLDRMDLGDFNPEAAHTVIWTRNHLSPESLAWLNDLPKDPVVVEEQFKLAHGSPRDSVWEYIMDPFIAGDNFREEEFKFCLVGHTHVPVIYTLPDGQSTVRVRKPVSGEALLLPDDGRAILNPGSVGQPRDGDPRSAYAILDTAKRLWLPRRVPYPIEITQAHMRDAGLPERLITRLSFGW